MYRFLTHFHIVTSSLFLIVAIAVTARSVAGWSKNLDYTRNDRYLRIAFMILLYLTLIHGIIMYFFIDPSSKSIDVQGAIKQASMRFWVIEHFYFMTFALILAQIGSIFIQRTKTDKNRFAYAAFYYGTATVITIISLSFYLIYR
jgi:hypothetical protein